MSEIFSISSLMKIMLTSFLCVFETLNRRLVSPVSKVPVYHAGGLGSIPGQTNTLDLKIIE